MDFTEDGMMLWHASAAPRNRQFRRISPDVAARGIPVNRVAQRVREILHFALAHFIAAYADRISRILVAGYADGALCGNGCATGPVSAKA